MEIQELKEAFDSLADKAWKYRAQGRGNFFAGVSADAREISRLLTAGYRPGAIKDLLTIQGDLEKGIQSLKSRR